MFRGDYGFQDAAKTLRNSSSTVYGISELCEPIGAALALMAQEKGLLSLQEPLGTYLPPFKDKPAPKVQDLLCHASGLPVFRLDPYGNAKAGSLTLDEMDAFFRALIGIGRPSRAVPATPPCVRVRTRRFIRVELSWYQGR